MVELPLAQGGLAGKQDPLELAGVQVDHGAPPVRRGVLVLMTAVCSKTTVGKAVDLLSGPGGLASFLRRRQLGSRLGGPSLPLDIGYAETVPAGIRHAVVLRDRHCQWAGRCDQPAAACEVHHTKHKANGGKTSVKDCVLLCWFHHQVAIHRWGWTLVLTRRHHHRLEQGQDQGAPQPRTTRPGRVTPPVTAFTPGSGQPRLRLPMLRDPLEGSWPSASASRT